MIVLGCSTRWCCDRHGETKLTSRLLVLGDEITRQWKWIYVTIGPEGKDCERKGKDCKDLVEAFVELRQNTYEADPICFLYDIEDIINEDGIGLIAKVSSSRLQRDGPDGITTVLEETAKWGSRHARGMLE